MTSVVKSNVIKQAACPPPICSLSSVSISLCSMTQSLSGSGQTFCSLRGVSGLPPSAVMEGSDRGEGGEREGFSTKVSESIRESGIDVIDEEK